MTIPPIVTGATGVTGVSGATPDDGARLRKSVQQLQGVFVEQLYKAMRETVPEGGMFDGGSGEQMFSGLLDQHLAEQTPAEWSRGLGDALYRQLSARMAEQHVPASPHPRVPEP